MPIKLYDYQLDAITKMHNGCILCGGVGSGKSRTALSYFYLKNGGTLESLQGNSYMHMKDPKDLIIITTARKRDTFEWEQEMSVFLMSPENGISPYGNRVIVDSWNNISLYSMSSVLLDPELGLKVSLRSANLTSGSFYQLLLGIPGWIIFRSS